MVKQFMKDLVWAELNDCSVGLFFFSPSKQGPIVALGKSIVPLFSHISGAKWSYKSIQAQRN